MHKPGPVTFAAIVVLLLLICVGGIPGIGRARAADTGGPAATQEVPQSGLPVPTGRIPLPRVEGRIDHFAFDTANGRLFVAALGNDSVEVLDIAKGQVAQHIGDLPTPQGIGIAPDSGRVLVANAGDGSCRVLDATTLEVVGKVNLKDDADNVRYDANARGFWVGYGSGGLALVDPVQIGTKALVRLTAHPESFQLEEKGQRIFVNVPDERCVVVVDREKKAVVAKWELQGVGANFPMALDEANHRLFVGCRRPARLVVLDTESGAQVAAIATVGDMDDVFHDARTKRLYASGGEGAVDVIAQDDANRYREVGRVKTASGARTSYFEPVSRTLYVAVPHRLGREAEVRVFQVEAPVAR